MLFRPTLFVSVMALKLNSLYRHCNVLMDAISLKIGQKCARNPKFCANLCTNTTCSSSQQNSISSVLKTWESKFKEENIPEPTSSIQNIILHVLGGRSFTVLEKYANTELTQEELEETNRLCECRLARMPIQYIIGEWDFRDIRLRMAPPVFIPRPETEQLVELALRSLPHGNECDTCDLSKGCKLNVLEVGVGSGAVSLALIKAHPKVHCVAIDQSGLACQLTQQNALDLGVPERINVLHSKLEEEATFSKDLGIKSFDLIVSNPPYVPSNQIKALEPEIMLYEDLRALDGGTDGLRLVKPLLVASSRLLQHKGRVVLEVDETHPSNIQSWLEDPKQSGLQLRYESTHKDVFGKPRFVQIIKMRDRRS